MDASRQQHLSEGDSDTYALSDRTPIDIINIGKNEIVFRMDTDEEERFRTPIPKSMVMCNESNKMHNNRAKQLTKKPKPRITVAIAAMTHEKDYMGHTRQYQGLLVYNNSGIRRNKIEEPIVGWMKQKGQEMEGAGLALPDLSHAVHQHQQMLYDCSAWDIF